MHRGALSPYGNPALLVDKMIGTAYDNVKLVADNLQLIDYISKNMELLHLIGSDLATTTQVLGVAGQPGETVTIPLPVGVLVDNITSSTVLLDDGENGLYGFEANLFTHHIKNGSLHLTMNNLAPPALAGASVRWTISHKV